MENFWRYLWQLEGYINNNFIPVTQCHTTLRNRFPTPLSSFSGGIYFSVRARFEIFQSSISKFLFSRVPSFDRINCVLLRMIPHIFLHLQSYSVFGLLTAGFSHIKRFFNTKPKVHPVRHITQGTRGARSIPKSQTARSIWLIYPVK